MTQSNHQIQCYVYEILMPSFHINRKIMRTGDMAQSITKGWVQYSEPILDGEN